MHQHLLPEKNFFSLTWLAFSFNQDRHEINLATNKQQLGETCQAFKCGMDISECGALDPHLRVCVTLLSVAAQRLICLVFHVKHNVFQPICVSPKA